MPVIVFRLAYGNLLQVYPLLFFQKSPVDGAGLRLFTALGDVGNTWICLRGGECSVVIQCIDLPLQKEGVVKHAGDGVKAGGVQIGELPVLNIGQIHFFPASVGREDQISAEKGDPELV